MLVLAIISAVGSLKRRYKRSTFLKCFYFLPFFLKKNKQNYYEI